MEQRKTQPMDIVEFTDLVKRERNVCPVLAATDYQLCETYAEVMVRLFREIISQEHKDQSQFQALKDAYECTARGAMRYLDNAGVTAAVASVAPLLERFSFEQNAPAMAFEATFIHRMGVPFAKISPFWRFVDLHKSAVIKRLCKPGFKLESLVKPAIRKFGTEKGGEDWEHLSPGFWRRMVGFGIAVVDMTTAVPTCGIAVASVVVGGIGVAAG